MKYHFTYTCFFRMLKCCTLYLQDLLICLSMSIFPFQSIKVKGRLTFLEVALSSEKASGANWEIKEKCYSI